MVYRSSAAAPVSQTQARIESQLCAGAAEPPAAAAELILNQEYGYMIAMKNQKITKVPLQDVAGKLKMVDPQDGIIKEARTIGISFGDQ